jgi:hypothetical protein
MTSSIVDIPKKAAEGDLFGINKYEKGLIEFIRNSDTPITIAIQGEWGSGKTSLMNSLQDTLCGDLGSIKEHDREFYGIWVNTWQYSLMNSQEETLISIVSSISTQIMHIVSTRHEGTGQKLASSVFNVFGRIAKTSAKFAADKVIEGGGDVVEALFDRERGNQNIKHLRDDLQTAIIDCLEKDKSSGKPKKGFLFFIDDLDRIDPPAAVQILELLKNIFDLEKCAFILAIDYDVVVKGLKPKFGELTDKNEREFRSFFDKIIQMPFSMPVASYNIDQFLIENLQKIGFLSDKQAKNDQLKQSLTTLCSLSVGTNPRSLKRLLNTVSLINIIAKQEEDSDDVQDEEYRTALNFALICIQIAYPPIYKTLSLEGNFRSWDENFARQLKLDDLKEEKTKLGESEEFDEEWEQVLYRICMRDNYLSNRAFQISQLLNLMFKIVPDGQDLGSLISDLLSLSSVTDVQAFDKPKQAINKGPVLKLVVSKLLPLLKNKLRHPWPTVRIQSKKIQSNAYISYSDKSWHDCIGFTVGAMKDYVVLHVWYHPWAFTQVTSNMEVDLKNAGFANELEVIKKEYQNITTNFKGVSFVHPPMEKSGSAKGWHVPLLTLQFQFSGVDDMVKSEGLESVAEIVTAFMDVNARLKSFYEAYNTKVKPT